MTQNPRLAELSAHGVSVWLDDLSRERLRTDNLADLIRTRSIVGVTTNPTIFAGALGGGDAYDEQLADLARRGIGVEEAVRTITTYDVRWAADVLAAAAAASGGRDGRVSIEVDPRLAHETSKTVAEARALWWLVDRPNLFIKIPSTVEGLPAITKALSEGVSVNVTLIFSLERYRAVMEAFLTGLEQRVEAGGSLDGLESVASFFVSRVDTEIDKRLETIGTDEANALLGKSGIANAILAYQAYEEVFASDRWKALEAQGAKPQRPLWASTGVKNPNYSDTMYISELVAPGIVNTMPEKTFEAYADHGEIGMPLTERYAEAKETLDRVQQLGISYDDVVAVLEREGVEKFEKSWAELLETVSGELAKAAGRAA